MSNGINVCPFACLCASSHYTHYTLLIINYSLLIINYLLKMEKGWVSSFTLYLDKVALRIEDEGMVAVYACEIASDDEAFVDLLGVAKDLVGEGEEGLVGSVLQVDVLEDVCPDATAIVLVALSEHGHVAQSLVESAFVEEVVEAAYHILGCDLSEQILVLAYPSGYDARMREE